MRIKLIINRETINNFKEKCYYLLLKNGHPNDGRLQSIQQERKKMNSMDLLSTLWLIRNFKKNQANIKILIMKENFIKGSTKEIKGVIYQTKHRSNQKK